jgi:hypothetical protein
MLYFLVSRMSLATAEPSERRRQLGLRSPNSGTADQVVTDTNPATDSLVRATGNTDRSRCWNVKKERQTTKREACERKSAPRSHYRRLAGIHTRSQKTNCRFANLMRKKGADAMRPQSGDVTR